MLQASEVRKSLLHHDGHVSENLIAIVKVALDLSFAFLMEVSQS